MIVLVQSSFHTTWASLFEMELEPNSLDWNGNELEHELELEDMKRTFVNLESMFFYFVIESYKLKLSYKIILLVDGPIQLSSSNLTNYSYEAH